MNDQGLNAAKAEAFGGRMLALVNNAMLGLMTSIGHRTELFDRMAGMPPSTSEQIAEAAGLNERYVREWLSAMFTGGIVEYDAGGKTFWLPPEHAACLTRAAGPDNVALFAQYIGMLADVEKKVVECFRNGGGVPYAEFGEFQALMAEESSTVHDAALIDVILPLVPGLPERLSEGIDALDVGCGSGHAVNLMAKAFPNSRFTGADFSDEGVAAANAEAKVMGLSNASFVAKDVSTVEHEPRYDLVTAFDAIHDQRDPAAVLSAIHSAVRPGGTFLCVDVAGSSNLEENREHPLGPALYTVSTMHCMTVSLALGGAGLGTMWGEQMATKMLGDAGFKQVDVKHVDGDIQNNYYVCPKD